MSAVGLAAELRLGIIDEHVRKATFLWEQRDRRVLGPRYDLRRLGRLEARLEAHIDGLRIAREDGFAACKEAIVKDLDPGALFAATLLAAERWDLPGVAWLLERGAQDAEAARGIVGALAYLPFDIVRPLLFDGLLPRRCPPSHQWLGIAACAAHREDPGPALANAVMAADVRLRARALRAVFEVGRLDLLGDLRAALGHDDDDIRFAAALSAAMWGEATALPPLRQLSFADDERAEQACAMVVRRLATRDGRELLATLWGRGHRFTAIAGAAASGDPALLPWLLDLIDSDETARAAGWAFTVITGLDMRKAKMKAKPPEGFEPDEKRAIVDRLLVWPDLTKLRHWWSHYRSHFQPDRRYLGGRPIEPNWLNQLLQDAPQPIRAAAATELCLLKRGDKPFAVRAPVSRQRVLLAQNG